MLDSGESDVAVQALRGLNSDGRSWTLGQPLGISDRANALAGRNQRGWDLTEAQETENLLGLDPVSFPALWSWMNGCGPSGA